MHDYLQKTAVLPSDCSEMQGKELKFNGNCSIIQTTCHIISLFKQTGFLTDGGQRPPDVESFFGSRISQAEGHQ